MRGRWRRACPCPGSSTAKPPPDLMVQTGSRSAPGGIRNPNLLLGASPWANLRRSHHSSPRTPNQRLSRFDLCGAQHEPPHRELDSNTRRRQGARRLRILRSSLAANQARPRRPAVAIRLSARLVGSALPGALPPRRRVHRGQVHLPAMLTTPLVRCPSAGVRGATGRATLAQCIGRQAGVRRKYTDRPKVCE